MCPPAPSSFPYTTLFRSRPPARSIAELLNSSRRATARSGIASRPALPARQTSSASRSPLPAPLATTTLLREVSLCSVRSEEHTSELQSLRHLVCRLLLEK